MSALVTAMIARWRLAGKVIGLTLLAAAIAVLVLPPVYESHASFVTAKSSGASMVSASGRGEAIQDLALRLGVGSVGNPSESPNFYVQLIESEELRRRLLFSNFHDPYRKSPRDSAALLDILHIRNSDPQRRVEIGLKKLAKAISTGVDMRTNLVELSVRLRWPDLAAGVANRTMAVVDEFNNEQRVSRAQSRRLFLQSRVDSVKAELQQAEARQHLFYDRNRQWRSAPQLVFEEGRLRRDATSAADFLFTLQPQLETARLDEFNDAVVITVIDAAVPPRKAQWPRYWLLVASALGVAAILAMLVCGGATILSGQLKRSRDSTGVQDGVSAVPSSSTRIVFALFAWGLAFHSLVIAALFGWFGLPQHLVRGIAAWKEVALAVLVVVIIVRAVTGRGPRTAIVRADFWVGGLIATAALFLLTENLWFRFDLPRPAELLGVRDAVYFMLAYFVGRAMPELASDDRTMRTLFVLIVVTSAIGIVERLVVSPEMLVGLGVASYFQDFLGLSAFTVGNDYGLPLNYWTRIGGHLFRRAGSVYLSGQGFAVPFLLFFPLATAWVFMRPKRSVAQLAAYAIVSVGLILTVTRTTILIALIQLMLFASLRKRPEWALGAVAIISAVIVAAFVVIPGFPTFLWQTLSWQESSSVSHFHDWVNGLLAFAEHPWGSGLGTADQTAFRAGLKHLTGDNLYLKYAVEMGMAGLTFFVLTLTAFGRSAMRLYRNGVTPAQRRMGMTLLLSSIGIAINGVTAVVFNSITLGWTFFWLAGAAVTVEERVTAEIPSPQSHLPRPESRDIRFAGGQRLGRAGS